MTGHKDLLVESQKILFASSSKDKLRRLKLSLVDLDLKFQSLVDLGLNKYPEPIENGETEVENANIKAKYYYDLLPVNHKMTVIAQDDGVYTPELPAEYQTGKNVKATVLKHMGASDQQTVYRYWAMLAKKYPGTKCIFSWNYSVYNGVYTRNYTIQIETRLYENVYADNDLQNALKKVDGAPLSLLSKIKIGDGEKYFSDLDEADYLEIGRLYFEEFRAGLIQQKI
jgi:hypothetical protein